VCTNRLGYFLMGLGGHSTSATPTVEIISCSGDLTLMAMLTRRFMRIRAMRVRFSIMGVHSERAAKLLTWKRSAKFS